MLCKEELIWKVDRYLTTNIFKAKTYKLGTLYMSNFLNPPLQELLGPSPSWFLIIHFVLKIHCALLLMIPRQLYLSLSVAECVLRRLFLMYPHLVCRVLIIKHTELSFFNNIFSYDVQDWWLTKCKPNNLIVSAMARIWLTCIIVNGGIGDLEDVNFTMYVWFAFSTNWFVLNHLKIRHRFELNFWLKTIYIYIYIYIYI
jgi:hypothetical protein